MLLLGFDLETTGLDPAKDRIVELGWCLWGLDSKMPLVMANDILSQESPIPAEATAVHGITDSVALRYGLVPKLVLEKMVDAIKAYTPGFLVAHNGNGFDIPFLIAECKRVGVDHTVIEQLPPIDTLHDIPFEIPPTSRKLPHLALDHGFMNPFPHRALFDVLTMLRVLSCHDLAKIIEYQKIPTVIVRAMVSYDERELAKVQRYQWEKVGDKTFAKSWVKAIKENQLDKERAACPFQVVKIE